MSGKNKKKAGRGKKQSKAEVNEASKSNGTGSTPSGSAVEQEGEAVIKEMGNNVQEADTEPIEIPEVKNLEGAMELIIGLKKELAEAQQEIANQTDRILRWQADFDNLRKRKNKELTEAIHQSRHDTILSLLPIIDNVDRALEAIEKTDNLAAIKEGITLLDAEAKKSLAKMGVERVLSLGTPFDSEIHEAVTAIPVEDEDKKGIVIDEVEKGYKLRDRVIRFPKVVVGE